MKRTLLALATLATAAVALWLLSASVTVLPARDPAHVGMWRGVAAGVFAYAALCAALLAAHGPGVWLRRIALLASLAAMAFGALGVVVTVQRANAGGHFEGYLVLMGLVLFGHGASAIAYTLFPPTPRAHLPAA